MDDGKSGAVKNVKNEQYVAMPDSWQAENNRDMNKGMGYGNMADPANTPHPATSMTGEKRNSQIMGNGSGDNNYNYNGNRK